MVLAYESPTRGRRLIANLLLSLLVHCTLAFGDSTLLFLPPTYLNTTFIKFLHHHAFDQKLFGQCPSAGLLRRCSVSSRPIGHQPRSQVLLQGEHRCQQRSGCVHLDTTMVITIAMLTRLLRREHLPDPRPLQRPLPGQIHLRRPPVPGMLVLQRQAV